MEWGLLLAVGAVRARSILGPGFSCCHQRVFFLAVPALASILTVRRKDTLLGTWFVAGLLCSFLPLPVVLTQYGVSEALYGMDGRGGPYAEP